MSVHGAGPCDARRPARRSVSTDTRSGIHIVLYDGTIYVSPDGRDYREAPVFQGLADTFSTHQELGALFGNAPTG